MTNYRPHRYMTYIFILPYIKYSCFLLMVTEVPGNKILKIRTLHYWSSFLSSPSQDVTTIHSNIKVRKLEIILDSSLSLTVYLQNTYRIRTLLITASITTTIQGTPVTQTLQQPNPPFFYSAPTMIQCNTSAGAKSSTLALLICYRGCPVLQNV